MALSNLNQGETAAVSSALSADAENYVNDPNIEMQWAIKAFHHAETYFNLITAVDPSILKLTRLDDEIYSQFRSEFPDMKVDVISEDQLKSVAGKEKWRPFCDEYKERVEDYNMGSLLRLDCGDGISSENTMLVPRVQFLAVEIARNREGLNSHLREKFKASKDS